MEISYQEADRINSDIAERLYYIAKLNPKGVNKLAVKYGYQMPKENLASKFNFLALWFQENGNDNKALDELILTHPDFNLFAETMAMKIGAMQKSNTVKKYTGPLNYEEDEDDGYIGIDEFNDYDGFMDDNNSYNGHDNMFLDAIAGVVKAGADTAGKFAGSGKRGTALKQAQAEEQTKQLQIQAKIDAKSQKAKTKKIVILSVVGVMVVLIAAGVFIYLRRKK